MKPHEVVTDKVQDTGDSDNYHSSNPHALLVVFGSNPNRKQFEVSLAAKINCTAPMRQFLCNGLTGDPNNRDEITCKAIPRAEALDAIKARLVPRKTIPDQAIVVFRLMKRNSLLFDGGSNR